MHRESVEAELSLEELGLEEGEALQTSRRQMIFGWSLVLVAFAIAIVVAAAVIVVLSYTAILGFFAVAFSGFAGP